MNNVEKLLLEEVLDLVKFLEDVEGNPNIDEMLDSIGKKYAAVEHIENLWVILDEMCRDMTDTYFILLEYLYAATKDEKVLRKQALVLTKGVSEGSIELFYAIFYKWQIISRNFMNFNTAPLFIERSNLHVALIDKMKQYLQYDLPPIEKSERNQNRVIITLTQLLGLKHGPTRNALDYCYTLRKDFNKEVFLLIAGEMPFETIEKTECYGLNYGYFNIIHERDGFFTWDYMGETFNGYQCKINPENRENIIDIIMRLYLWKPYLVYNIGSENIIGDICGSFTEEISVPLGNLYPITEAKYHVLTRNIEDRDKGILDYLKGRNKKVIESIFVYKLEEPIKRYKKSDFGIDEKAFVIVVVGTRLEQEVDKDFTSIIQTLLEMDPSITIVFMGSFERFDQWHEKNGYSDQLKYLGHQSDLRGSLNSADLYLNPPRKGGGTSSAEALAEGVPVITLGNCDVAYTCGNEFLCKSLDVMPELVRKYMTEKEFYEEQRKKAYIQAGKVVNTEEVLRGILEQID